VLALAVAARSAALATREQVEGDGVHYASLARQALIGDFSGLANPYWSNLWPGVIAGTAAATGLDVVAAGRAASFVSGLALVLLTGAIASRVFGRVEGTLAAVLAAAHPWLVQFSALVFTESFFAMLMAALVLGGLALLDDPSPRLALGAGVLAGAGLLTRPETYGVVFVLVVGLLIVGRRTGRRSFIALAIFLAVAAAALGARALLIHHYFRQWDFGHSKGTANLLLGLAQEKEHAYAGLTPAGENSLEVELRRWTMTSFLAAHPGLVLRHVGSNIVLLASHARSVYPPLPVSLGRPAFGGTPLWTAIDVASFAALLLAASGLVRGLRGAHRRAGAVCGAVVAVYLLGLSALYVHERMIVASTPFVLVLLAGGAAGVARPVPGGFSEGSALALGGLLLGLTTFGVLRSESLDYATEPRVQKEAGLWLRARYAQDQKLMTAAPTIAFYFYDAAHQENAVDFPWAEYDSFLAFARRTEVDLVAAPEWHLRAGGFPVHGRLVPDGDHPGLRHVGTVGRPPRLVHVFRVEKQDR
jgi:hypothetical protein